MKSKNHLLDGRVNSTLAFLSVFMVFSLSLAPNALAAHDAIISISPEVANCDVLGNTFTVNVENSGDSVDDIFEVRIYDESYTETYGIVEFQCGPAPAGWTLYDFTDDYGYCEYKTPQFGAYVIEPGESIDFSFDAVMFMENCYSKFLISTLDNAVPIGQHEYYTPQVNIDCTAPTLEKTVGTPKIPGVGFDFWITQDTIIGVTADEDAQCDLGLD